MGPSFLWACVSIVQGNPKAWFRVEFSKDLAFYVHDHLV